MTTVDHRRLRQHADRVADLAASGVPDFASIVWKGSSRKAWRSPYDFIPGLSDIDIHVYVDGPVDSSIAGAIEHAAGPGPGGSPTQVLVMDRTDLPPGWMLLPEAYTVLRGRDPEVALPPYGQMVSQAWDRMLPAGATAERLRGELARVDDPWRMLVTSRSAFTPMLYRAAIHFAGHDPTKVWTLSRSEMIEATEGTPSLDRLREAVTLHLDAAITAAYGRDDWRLAADALEAGIGVLDVTAEMVIDAS